MLSALLQIVVVRVVLLFAVVLTNTAEHARDRIQRVSLLRARRGHGAGGPGWWQSL